MIHPAQTLRVLFRSLWRTPGFTATTTLTLALGIGLTVAVFTVAQALLVRPLPFRDQDRVVALWGQPADRSYANWPLSLGSAQAFSRDTRSFERAAFVAYEGAWPVPIREGDQISRLRQALVSGDFFDVLGGQPRLGRSLRTEDDRVGAAPVAVISYGAWQRRFGRRSEVLGQQIVIHGNGVAYTIVGVMPPGFDYPKGADFWAPINPAKTAAGSDTAAADVNIVGRLRAGVSSGNAADELTSFFNRPESSPWQRSMIGVATPLPRLILGETRPAVLAFALASILLLIITCVNIANLLVVRGFERTREVAVRTALGASRGRMVVQLLAENMMIAALGGLLGVGVAAVAVRTFVMLAPAGLPRLGEIQLDTLALAGALGITAIATLLFGVAPAIMTSRVDVQHVLRSGGRQGMSRGARRATEALVIGQVTLAVIVLSGAGLIARSLIRLEGADLAFEGSHLLIGDLALRYDQVDNREKQLALLDRVLPAVRAVAGVQSVSPVVAVPFSGSGGWDIRLTLEGQSSEVAAGNPVLNMDVVVPEYFETFGITPLRGRGFTERDREGAPQVVVVSQTAARALWPGADALGKRVSIGAAKQELATVVGIVPDTRYRDLREARASVYFPLRQSPFPFAPMTLAIRTSGAPTDMVPVIRRTLSAIDPSIGLAGASAFDEFLNLPLAQPRLNAWLLGVFAAAALVIAAIGLFGVVTTMVVQRTHEFGVRMALGATGGNLRTMVLRRGLALAIVGLVIGLLVALSVNRLLVALLYGVTPSDPLTMAVVAVALLTVATLASLVPAHSSTRISPATALRAEG